MQNTGLDEAQAGIKISGRNINNLRYTDDTTLMAESKEELMPILLKLLQKTAEKGTTDWFQIGKGVRQGCILSPCLFNLYAEYTMRNAGLEEAQDCREKYQ